MTDLATEHLLYLLYAVAYSKNGKATQGQVKKSLPKQFQKDAERLCQELCQQGAIASPKKGQIRLTEESEQILFANLSTTAYQFTASKGYKILNLLLKGIQYQSAGSTVADVDEMDFKTFVEEFKALYMEERRQQELRGVVAIRSQKLCQDFSAQHTISKSKLNQYFEQLKSTGKIFAVIERDQELIQWAE